MPPTLLHLARTMAPALLLAGCVSLAPPYQTPPLPVTAQIANHGAASARPLPPLAATTWAEYFPDPTLQQLIRTALDNNRDLRSAVLRVDEAQAAYAVQRSAGQPAIGLQAGATRTRVPAELSYVGRAISANQFQLSAGLASWELDFWGAVRNRNDAALNNYLATDAARRAATLALIAQVADSYLALRETDERLALARQTVATREESMRITTRRMQVGSTSRLNLAQVHTLLTQAQALAAQLAQSRDAQSHALTLLAGTTVDIAPASTPLDPAAATEALPGELPSTLLLLRPDIVAAEHQLRASNANIGAARAAYFPRVALTGSFGTASTELQHLFSAGSQSWSVAPSITLPLFDGGARAANLGVAESRRALALTAYDKAILSAFRDVADALSARRWLVEQWQIASTALAAQSERARLSQLRYDNGAAAFLDVLDAQRDLLQAQQQLVQTRRALLSNRVALYAALGGGALTLTDTK